MKLLKTIIREWKWETTLKYFLIIVLIFQMIPYSIKSQSLELRHYPMPAPGLGSIEQSGYNLPVADQADVVVAGGGIAGVMAALQAAEKGLSVIIIESRNYLGQEYTSTFYNHTQSEKIPDIFPYSREVFSEISKRYINDGYLSNPNALRPYLLGRVSAHPNIQVFFNSLTSGVLSQNNRVHGLVFSSINGRYAILAKALVDATEDARLSVSAGATMIRTLKGDNIARRFISALIPANFPPGMYPVPHRLGIRGDSIVVYNGSIEFSTTVHIGENTAKDFSEAHIKTNEISFSLRDYLSQEGITLGSFAPSPETWFDKVPVVKCLGHQKNQDEVSFSTPETGDVLPIGIDGLVVAGRTTGLDSCAGSIQTLLITGELAGRAAIEIAERQAKFPVLEKVTDGNLIDADAIAIKELPGMVGQEQQNKFVYHPPVELPVIDKYDVLVIGGGTSGAVSAISAARHGARVAVVEFLPNLGGTGSNKVFAYFWGVPWKSLLRLEIGKSIHLYKKPAFDQVGFSGEDKKNTLQDLSLRDGVKVFYSSLVSGAVVDSNKVIGVVVENSLGRHILLADVVIDATGQASVAVAAGAGFEIGRSTDGFLHEMEHGPLRNPTDLKDISQAYMTHYTNAINLNIRESRRIIGDYTVTFDDVIHERFFPDVICRWRANYDTHFPNSANQSDLAQDWTTILGLWFKPVWGSIPYRSILPKGLKNIMVIGKAYSTDHDALIGGRMQPDLEHLGEAAGVAAAMACSLQVSPRDIPVSQLQTELVQLGILRNEDIQQQNTGSEPSLSVLQNQDFWKEERDQRFPPNILGAAPSLEELVSMLGTKNSLDAIVELYLAGDEVIPLLQPLLESKYKSVYEEAALLLGLLGDRSAIPALMEFIEERNTRTFRYTVPQRPSVPLYWTSVILLGRFGEPDAVPLLLELLESAPPPEDFHLYRRKRGFSDNLNRGTDICPPPLVSFIVVALGRMGDTKAAPYIRPFLKVSNDLSINSENLDFEIMWGVQTNAVKALAQLGDYSGIPALIELLNAEQQLLRNYAHQLLEDITGEQFGIDPMTWMNWWKLRDKTKFPSISP